MKIACPRCGTTEIKDAHPSAVKPLNCKRGHAFHFEEGLISFSDAVVTAQAIGHPTRLRILLEFGRRAEMSNSEVAKIIGVDPGTTHYHINRLRDHTPPLLKDGRAIPKNGATLQMLELNRGLFEN
jgi:hypothetical protein